MLDFPRSTGVGGAVPREDGEDEEDQGERVVWGGGSGRCVMCTVRCFVLRGENSVRLGHFCVRWGQHKGCVLKLPITEQQIPLARGHFWRRGVSGWPVLTATTLRAFMAMNLTPLYSILLCSALDVIGVHRDI